MNDEEIKAIERCNELIKESRSCWIGITNQEAIQTVLNLIEKQKAEIDYKDEEMFNIVNSDKGKLYVEIKTQKERIEYLKRSIDRKEDSLIEEYQNNIELETKLQEKDKEIETLKRDFEIVDHECSRLEQEDIRKDIIIKEMAKQLSDYKYEELICMEIDCRHIEIQNEGKCIGDVNCIIEYFENKVKEKQC